MTETKFCSRCITDKPRSEFRVSKQNKDGLGSWCKSCCHVYRLEYYKKTLDTVKFHGKRYRRLNKLKIDEHRKLYNQLNSEKIAKRHKAYAKKNPKRIQAVQAKRRAAKMLRAPSWVSKEERKKIYEFYLNCPKGFHVDHIVPLQGLVVSGFHCLSNLQYLPAKENISKGNRFELKYA